LDIDIFIILIFLKTFISPSFIFYFLMAA
jgi:hypothetical protein